MSKKPSPGNWCEHRKAICIHMNSDGYCRLEACPMIPVQITSEKTNRELAAENDGQWIPSCSCIQDAFGRDVETIIVDPFTPITFKSGEVIECVRLRRRFCTACGKRYYKLAPNQ